MTKNAISLISHSYFQIQSLPHLTSMKVFEFVGLQMFELSYLGVLAVLPFFVAQKYIGGLILTLLLLIGSYHAIRKYLYRAIQVNGQGVVITGCDTGIYGIYREVPCGQVLICLVGLSFLRHFNSLSVIS